MHAARRAAERLISWGERTAKTDVRYLLHSGFWMNAQTVILSILAFLLYIIFGRYVSQEAFGTYQYLLSVAAIISSFTLTGMNSAVTQAVARGHEGAMKDAVHTQLRLGIVPLSLSLAGALYYFTAGNALFALCFVIMGFGVPAMSAFNTYGAFLAGRHLFAASFWYSLALYVPYYALLAVTAILWGSPFALFVMHTIVQAAATILIYRNVVSRYKPTDEHDGETSRFGTQLSVANFFGAATGQLDNILAFQFLGPAPLAVYSFASAIPDRAGGLLKFASVVALPKFATRTDDEIRTTLPPKVALAAAFTLVSAALYAVVAPFIFHFLFPAYKDAIPYSQWYALIMLTYVTGIPVAALIAQKRTRAYGAFIVSSSAVQTALQLTGIIMYGLWGLVAGKIIGTVIALCIALTLVLYPRRTPTSSSH